MSKKFSIGLHVFSFLLIAFILFKVYGKRESIVFINTTKLVSGYEGMKISQKSIEIIQGKFKANVDTLGVELENEIKKFEKERPNLNAKEIKLSEELLRGKQQQFYQYQQTMQKKSSEAEQMERSKIGEVIDAFLKEYGKRYSYKFILGANNLGNIVYADEEYDITDKVLNELNERYKKNK